MRKYEIKIVPNVDVEGKTYWKAFFPAIEGCVGGGNTAEEAVNEAQENLEVYFPKISLCTDNAAMIASAGYYNFKFGENLADLTLSPKARIDL